MWHTSCCTCWATSIILKSYFLHIQEPANVLHHHTHKPNIKQVSTSIITRHWRQLVYIDNNQHLDCFASFRNRWFALSQFAYFLWTPWQGFPYVLTPVPHCGTASGQRHRQEPHVSLVQVGDEMSHQHSCRSTHFFGCWTSPSNVVKFIKLWLN